MDEATGDEDKLVIDQVKLQRLKQEYTRFSKGVGLPAQHARMEAAGFDWKKGKAAEKAIKETVSGTNKSQQRQSIGKVKNPKNRVSLSNNAGTDRPNKTISETWDNSRGSKSWEADKYEHLVSTERASVQSSIEIGTLYNADGKRIFRLEGDAENVNFTDTQIEQMHDGTLTHNHTGIDYGCFSPKDINMLRRAHLCEIRCATPIGVFSIQSPTTWPAKINSFDKIEDTYYDIYERIGKGYYARAMMGEISLVDAENISQRVTVEELYKRYKIPFQFET